jgi:hypothetical protein
VAFAPCKLKISMPNSKNQNSSQSKLAPVLGSKSAKAAASRTGVAKQLAKAMPSAAQGSKAAATPKVARTGRATRLSTATIRILEGSSVLDAMGFSPTSRKRARDESKHEAELAIKVASAAKQKAEELQASVQLINDETHKKMLSAWNKIQEVRRSGKPLATGSPFGTKGKLSISKVASHFGVDRINLNRAVLAGGVNKPGRPPKSTNVDIEVLHSAVTVASLQDDAMSAVALDNLQQAAVRRGTPYKTGAGGALAWSTKRRLESRIKDAGVIKTVGIATDHKRLKVSRATLEAHAEEVLKLVKKYPSLRNRKAWVNVDETPNCERGEKQGRQLWVLTSRTAMKCKRGKAVRSRAMKDGNGPLTFVPALRGDGVIICTAFLSTGECPTPPLYFGELLPGLGNPFSDPVTCRLFATKAGSMTTEVLEAFLTEMVIPAMRRDVPDGPLVIVMDAPSCHGRTTELRAFLSRHDVKLLLLPHNSSTLTQMLDIGWFLYWRDEYQSCADALLEVSKSAHARLSHKMRVVNCT